MSKIEMSAVIITRDDRERVVALTRKLLVFLSEVVVLVDDRSEAGLLEELRSIRGCVAELHTFVGFGIAKQKVVSLAKNDWIFSLDADEIPNTDCIESLLALDLTKPNIYKIQRLNHYCGRPIKACGWYPDHVVRVFHREVANFSADSVHESVKAFDEKMTVQKLDGQILHYSFSGSHDLLAKLISYSVIYAENYQGKAKPVPLILLRSVFAFGKFYFLKKGILYGRDGFIISLMNAGGVFHKHWRAAEIVKQRKSN